MTNGLKFVIVLIIICAAFFATSSGFFYAKNKSLQADLNKKNDTVNKTTETPKTVAVTTPTTAVETPTTSPVVSSSTDSRPSFPTDTVVVAEGETLFAIGQKTGVTWTQIAEANGIDANKIKIGQTLIIPKNNQVGFTLNKSKATSLQTDVTNGKYQFRLIAADTAKADAPSAYGLTADDNYVQTKIDLTAGSATVTATKDGKTFTITLIQPVTKGEKGIWAIESIKKN